MKTKLLAVLAAFVLILPSLWAADDKMSEQETDIIKLVPQQHFADGGYTVVSPNATIPDMDFDDPDKITKAKNYLTEHLQTNGVVLTKLVDRLVERNKKVVRLTIKSSPDAGYVVDYDGKHHKYLGKDGGGWVKWYKEYPKAHGYTTVSMPVYDEKTGLVLVYRGTQSYALEGSGWIILYKYEHGKLKELNSVMMWIS